MGRRTCERKKQEVIARWRTLGLYSDMFHNLKSSRNKLYVFCYDITEDEKGMILAFTDVTINISKAVAQKLQGKRYFRETHLCMIMKWIPEKLVVMFWTWLNCRNK